MVRVGRRARLVQSVANQATKAQLEAVFSHLGTRDSYSIESRYDPAYNCIAFAAGDTKNWWWPVGDAQSGDVYWPDHAPNEVTLRAFEATFASLGYEVCDDDQLEKGYEKITFYALQDVPTHAPRQNPDSGAWLSKMGEHVDIEHQRSDSLEGPQYGYVCRHMKRRLRSQ